MKILITGIHGQVGHALVEKLTDHKLIAFNRQNFDLTNSDQMMQEIDQHQPDLIINCAAYTKVDQAEYEPETAFMINRDAPRIIAKKACDYKIPFIHFSTDYVFDGEKKDAYLENDTTNPLGIYGQSKCEGEKAIQEVGGQTYIFRTSWVYSNIGHNFYLTIKKLCQEREELKVVADQTGVPTSNQFIAKQMKNIIPQLKNNNIGIYHLVSDGSCSWYEFSKSIIAQTNPQFNMNNLQAIETNDFPIKTKRPKNSILNNSKIKQTFKLELHTWDKELEKIINEA